MAATEAMRLARDIVRSIQSRTDLNTPYAVARRFSLPVEKASAILDLAPSMLGPGGRGEEVYFKAAERVILGKKPSRLTRDALIGLLAKDLTSRDPRYRGHEEDARHLVSHSVPGEPDSLRLLAVQARNKDLISEDEYVRTLGKNVLESRALRKHHSAPSMPPGTRRA